VKLPYARDRFGPAKWFPRRNTLALEMFTKAFAYASLIDDTFDVHATLEESRMFDEAIERQVLYVVVALFLLINCVFSKCCV
jgi:hypothetical protein